MTKTGIMYAAMLNFAQVSEYTAMMKENGLLDYFTADRTFQATEKGRELLMILNASKDVLQKNTEISEYAFLPYF